MKLELATQNDYHSIIAFYDDVTERTPEMAGSTSVSALSIAASSISTPRTPAGRTSISLSTRINKMKQEINPKNTSRAQALRCMSSPTASPAMT